MTPAGSGGALDAGAATEGTPVWVVIMSGFKSKPLVGEVLLSIY